MTKYSPLTLAIQRQFESLLRSTIKHDYCKGVGKAYNQMNGGSANGDAFVD